jgi:hypothetical protein
MKRTFFAISTIATVVGTTFLAGNALAQEVPATLEQEMPYAEAREILLDAGWQAISTSPDQEPVGSTEDRLINELGYQEFVACSGTGMGFCRAEFVAADQRKLVLVTVDNSSEDGPILDRWGLEESF